MDAYLHSFRNKLQFVGYFSFSNFTEYSCFWSADWTLHSLSDCLVTKDCGN